MIYELIVAVLSFFLDSILMTMTPSRLQIVPVSLTCTKSWPEKVFNILLKAMKVMRYLTKSGNEFIHFLCRLVRLGCRFQTGAGRKFS